MTRVSLPNSQAIRSKQIFFFGLGFSFLPTHRRSPQCFKTTFFFVYHGAQSYPITILYPSSYIWLSLFPWISNSYQVEFFIPCYALKCSRSLNGISASHYRTPAGINFPYLENHSWRTGYQHSKPPKQACELTILYYPQSNQDPYTAFGCTGHSFTEYI